MKILFAADAFGKVTEQAYTREAEGKISKDKKEKTKICSIKSCVLMCNII